MAIKFKYRTPEQLDTPVNTWVREVIENCEHIASRLKEELYG